MEKEREKPNYMEEYPDFYKVREGFLEEDEPDLFVGRGDILKGYWWIVRDLTETTTLSHNTALMSMRKVGKTAFLKRFLNVVHEEQDIVLPLYYEFKNEKRDIYEVADEIVFTFIKQALLFYTRKKKEIKDIKNLEEIKEYIKENIKEEVKDREKEDIYKKLNRKIKLYESEKERIKGGEGLKRRLIEEALNISIDILDIIESIKRKKQKAIVVIDEAQNLIEGIIDEEKYKSFEEVVDKVNKEVMEEEKERKKKSNRKIIEEEEEEEEERRKERNKRRIEIYSRIDCRDAITTIINEPRMCTILSGSKPSMIRYDIICNKENRIPNIDEMPLMSKKEVKELVEKIVEKYKGDKIKKAYKSLYRDLYRLVGGNPFYIKNILISEKRKESREFRNKKDLIRIFNKEAKEKGGRIYEFWKGHFVDNLKKLNGRKGEIGLGFKIMKLIGERMEEYIEKQDKVRRRKSEMEEKNILLSARWIQRELKRVKIGGREEGEKRSLDEVDRKLTRLSKGDFIEYSPIGYVITAIKDRVLPLIMDILYFDLKELEWKEEVERESEENIKRRLEIKRIKKRIEEMNKNIDKLEKDLGEAKKDIKENKEEINKIIGEERNRKGLDAEELVKEKINKGEWELKEKYKVIGRAEERNIKIKNERGKYERAQIDVEVILEDRETKEEKIMIIEVKNQERKINKKDVSSIIEKFKIYEKAKQKEIEEIKEVKKDEKEKEIIKVIIYKKGIFKTSKILAERNNIRIYSFEDLFGEEIIKELEEINKKAKISKRKKENKEEKDKGKDNEKEGNKKRKKNKK